MIIYILSIFTLYCWIKGILGIISNE